MSLELKHLYSITILVSIFGQDLSRETITLVDVDTGAPRHIPLYQALLETSCISYVMYLNVVRLLCSNRLFGWRITPRERRIRKNARSVRAFAAGEIRKRKAGVTKSNDDILQVLLDNEINEDAIVD